MCGALCAHLAARQTPPGDCTLEPHTHVCVCCDSNRWEKTLEFPALVLPGPVSYALSAIVPWTCEVVGGTRPPLAWDSWEQKEPWVSGTRSHSSSVWSPLGKLKMICPGDLFFSLKHTMLKHTLLKRTPALMGVWKVPWNAGPVSGMYRFNESIWKLMKMKRGHSGYVTHDHYYLSEPRGSKGSLQLLVSRPDTFRTKILATAVLGS